jgi:hypothetical protein
MATAPAVATSRSSCDTQELIIMPTLVSSESLTVPWELADYQPLVTTGGGALPLPTKQPAKLSEPTTNATASASFFTYALLLVDRINARSRAFT